VAYTAPIAVSRSVTVSSDIRQVDVEVISRRSQRHASKILFLGLNRLLPAMPTCETIHSCQFGFESAFSVLERAALLAEAIATGFLHLTGTATTEFIENATFRYLREAHSVDRTFSE
jgi:hypothetical protein